MDIFNLSMLFFHRGHVKLENDTHVEAYLVIPKLKQKMKYIVGKNLPFETQDHYNQCVSTSTLCIKLFKSLQLKGESRTQHHEPSVLKASRKYF